MLQRNLLLQKINDWNKIYNFNYKSKFNLEKKSYPKIFKIENSKSNRANCGKK